MGDKEEVFFILVRMDKANADKLLDAVEVNGLHFFDIVQNAFTNPNSQEEAIVALQMMLSHLDKLEGLLTDNQMEHRTRTVGCLLSDSDAEKIRSEISELFNEKSKLAECIRTC